MNDNYFRRKLQSVLTDNKYDREVGGYRSGKIDKRKLRRVATNNTRVFKRRVERKGKNYSVVLVVDISGSMAGEKITLAAESVAKTYVALLSQEIEVAILAVNEVSHLVKDFGTEYDAEDIARHLKILCQSNKQRMWDSRLSAVMDSMYPGYSGSTGGTHDWLALQDANVLLAGKDGGRIIMSYSDGEQDTREGELLKMEVNRAMKSGIVTLGIGIRSDAVHRYFPDYTVVRDLSELHSATVRLLSKHITRG